MTVGYITTSLNTLSAGNKIFCIKHNSWEPMTNLKDLVKLIYDPDVRFPEAASQNQRVGRKSERAKIFSPCKVF